MDNRLPAVRDALLWGAAALPLVALALVPRRSQLSRMRAEFTTLSQHSTQNHHAIREELAELRRAHAQALGSLNARNVKLESSLARLMMIQSKATESQEASMTQFGKDLSSIAKGDLAATAERQKLDQRVISVLEETREQLAASRK